MDMMRLLTTSRVVKLMDVAYIVGDPEVFRLVPSGGTEVRYTWTLLRAGKLVS